MYKVWSVTSAILLSLDQTTPPGKEHEQLNLIVSNVGHFAAAILFDSLRMLKEDNRDDHDVMIGNAGS